MSDELPQAHPSDGETVQAALTAVYNWNYEPEIEELRTLYANALERQWIALRDLDWKRGVDREAFASSFSLGGLQIQQTDFWRALPDETRWKVSSGLASFMLSNFLHGEQGALMVASQLVNAVPDMAAKFYAATQTLDEARHVEVFTGYTWRGETRGAERPARGDQDLCFQTADGWITAGTVGYAEWQGFARAAERPDLLDDERFRNARDLVARADERLALMAEILATRSSDEWLARLDAEGVPCAPVLSRRGVIEHPQVAANGLIVEDEHPHAGPMRQPRPAARFSETPAAIRRPAPLLGEHTDEVLAELGLDADAVAGLRSRNVVG